MEKQFDEKALNEIKKLIEGFTLSLKDECLEVENYVENDLLKTLEIPNAAEWVTNPYSGKKCLLNPVQVALYDYIKGAERTLNRCYCRELNKKYSNAKCYFRNKWPNEYRTLLD